MAGVIERDKHQLIQINCMPDHTHILLEFRPAKDLVQLVENIQNQEEHHRKRTFREEYLEMLSGLEKDYEDDFSFDFY